MLEMAVAEEEYNGQNNKYGRNDDDADFLDDGIYSIQQPGRLEAFMP